MADNGHVERLPDRSQTVEKLTYLPLPILNIETAQITLTNGETDEPETFVRIIYQDIGGEKALWLPCATVEGMPDSMAVAFGKEIMRLGQGGQMGGVVPPKPRLWTP